MKVTHGLKGLDVVTSHCMAKPAWVTNEEANVCRFW